MNMISTKSIKARMWSKLGQRGTLGVCLAEMGNHLDNLMVLTADLATTSGLDRYRKTHPDKFLNVGIAEQNMIGIAAGLAKEHHIVFASTFATFAAMRSFEQVRVNLGYMAFNVKLVGLASGFAMGMFGNTHYGIEDIALMRAIPNMTILSPADCVEVAKSLDAAALYDGPVYIRLTGTMNNPMVYQEDYLFEIGKAITLRKGSDIAIIATGSMVHHSLEAAKMLEEQGCSATVVDMHTIKPLDTTVIDDALDKQLIVSVEEHSTIGGLGSAIAEHTSRIGNTPPQLFIGAHDAFPKAGDYKYLLEQNALTAPQIAESIANAMKDPARAPDSMMFNRTHLSPPHARPTRTSGELG